MTIQHAKVHELGTDLNEFSNVKNGSVSWKTRTKRRQAAVGLFLEAEKSGENGKPKGLGGTGIVIKMKFFQEFKVPSDE